VRRNKPPLEPAQARDTALRLLGRREHSARELKAKLQARGLDREATDEVVADLSDAGWQSDARYAEVLVRSRTSQGHGPLRIEAEMRMAGLDADAIRAALDAADVDWDELAQQVWQRKYGALPQSLSERQQQYRFMAGRGFEARSIGRILKGDPDD
jgi:regulatory protein